MTRTGIMINDNMSEIVFTNALNAVSPPSNAVLAADALPIGAHTIIMPAIRASSGRKLKREIISISAAATEKRIISMDAVIFR